MQEVEKIRLKIYLNEKVSQKAVSFDRRVSGASEVDGSDADGNQRSLRISNVFIHFRFRIVAQINYRKQWNIFMEIP